MDRPTVMVMAATRIHLCHVAASQHPAMRTSDKTLLGKSCCLVVTHPHTAVGAPPLAYAIGRDPLTPSSVEMMEKLIAVLDTKVKSACKHQALSLAVNAQAGLAPC